MRKIVLSGMVGNALEWYDFALYGQLSSIISKLFFPSNNQFISYLATFGVFAVGFLMRPLGGIFFGRIGDKFGRKTSLVASILCMAIPTACIGLMPTYQQIGVLAPILLTIIRLLQGLALGGGSSGCIAFVVEHAPDNMRGFAGSAPNCSMGLGILCGLIISYSLSHFLPNEDFETWGWRIPFIISLFVGLIALYIRDHIHESPKFLSAKKAGHISKSPVKEVFTKHKKELMVAIGIYLTVTVPFYTLTIFMNNYMIKILHHSMKDAFLMNGLGILSYIITVPFVAKLSDNIGRKPVLVVSSLLFLMFSYPIFNLLTSSGFFAPLVGQMVLGVVLAAYISPIPALLVELFPTSVRLTGVSISYNVSAAIFGGTSPMIIIWLINYTNLNLVPAFYIMFFALLSLFSLYYFEDKFDRPL